jgi:hypothetical protein
LRPFVVPSLPGLAIRISERSRADQDVYVFIHSLIHACMHH